MNSLLKLIAGLFAFAYCAIPVLGNGFTLGDQDAFATARGGAFAATADNPSAIYYNPAGIAQLEGDNLRGGLYGIYLDQTYSAPGDSTTFRNSDHLAAVPSGFYTHTFKNSPVTAGLGIYAPYGGSIEWPTTAGSELLPFWTDGNQGKLTYLSVNPAVALKLPGHVFLGAGVMANYVELSTDYGLLLSPAGNFLDFKGDGLSVGYNLGALWQPIKQLSFGASFRSSAPVNLKGRTDVEEQPFIPAGGRPASMSLTFPLNAIAGVSWRPTANWNLEFNTVYTGWSSFGATTLYEQSTPGLGFPQNISLNFDWQNSWTYELGVTRYLGKEWHVSAGYAFDENSVPTTYYNPLVADLDRHFFSLGLGFTGKTINFDVTYQFGYGPSHTVSGSNHLSNVGTAESADGTYAFFSNAVMVSAGIHF